MSEYINKFQKQATTTKIILALSALLILPLAGKVFLNFLGMIIGPGFAEELLTDWRVYAGTTLFFLGIIIPFFILPKFGNRFLNKLLFLTHRRLREELGFKAYDSSSPEGEPMLVSRGHFRGYPLTIESGCWRKGNKLKFTTRILAQRRDNKFLEFTLKRNLFRNQSATRNLVPTGDPEFDETLLCFSSDVEATQRILSPDLRQKLTRAMGQGSLLNQKLKLLKRDILWENYPHLFYYTFPMDRNYIRLKESLETLTDLMDSLRKGT